MSFRTKEESEVSLKNLLRPNQLGLLDIPVTFQDLPIAQKIQGSHNFISLLRFSLRF